MAHSEIKIETSWGETIYGNAWVVDEKNSPIANIVIAHGMGEYSFRYDPFARFLNTLGYNVYAVDQPGHGLNVTATKTPKYGLGVWPNNGFKTAINYLHELIVNVRLNMLPTILLGHSMGSFVSQRYYQRFPGTLDGLVLSGSSANNFSFVMGRAVSRIMNRFSNDQKRKAPSNFFKKQQTRKFNRGFKAFPDGYHSENRWLSANEANVQAFDKDPLCGFVCSFNFYFNLFGGLKPTFQIKRVKEIKHPVPILLVSGAEDPVGSKGKGVRKLEKFYRDGGQTVYCKLYPGMRHEILNEVECQTVYNDIADHIALCVARKGEEQRGEEHHVKEDIVA